MKLSGRLLDASDRIYQLLLWAYPPDFRQRYGSEMAQVFHDSCREALTRNSVLAIAGLYLHTLGDLVISALRERATTFIERPKSPKYAEERSLTMPLSGQLPAKMSFDRFTKRAKNVLQLATEEASALNHSYIGTEHLLLGLIRERKGVSGEVLHSLGATLDQARGATQSVVGIGKQTPVEAQRLSRRAAEALERAVDQAEQLNHRFVGTEHLLLGLIDTSRGAAGDILSRLGMPADTVRGEVLRVLKQGRQ